MAYNGVMDDVKKCIGLGVPGRLPVFALTEEFDSERAGMTYEEYSSSAKNIAKAHIDGIERFDYDWACVYIDDCLEFEPLGVKSVGSGDIPKSVAEFLPATYQSLNGLRVPDPHKDGRMQIHLEAISRLRDRFGDSVVICGRTPAPFSAATLLFGLEPAMLLMFDEPELLHKTMEFLIEVETTYAEAQIRAGAHALWIGDCSASSRFISIEHFRDFAAKPAKELISRIRSMGAFSFYFGAEKNVEHLMATAELGADVIGLSENADINECKETIGNRVCLMGNLDPINIIQDGTPELVDSVIHKIISTVSCKGGHLFNTGEGVTRSTPVKNVEVLVGAIRKYGNFEINV